MCVITCDKNYVHEDAGTTYLTWQNGQYVPAPPMFYMPDLRAILQKQAEQARWRATRTCALPSNHYPGRPPIEAKRAVFSEETPRITAADFNQKDCQNPAPASTIIASEYPSETGCMISCTRVNTNNKAADEGHRPSQQSPQSSAAVANISPPESSTSSQNDSLSMMAHSIIEGDNIPQQATQIPGSASSNRMRPLPELSSSKVRPEPKPKTLSSAATMQEPAPETLIDKAAAPSLSDHASTRSTTSLKSILKRHSTSTSTVSQRRPQRRKHVRFTSDPYNEEYRAVETLSTVNPSRRNSSPPPVATRIKSPPQHHPRCPSSSARKANLQLMEFRAELAKAGQENSGRDRTRQWERRPHAKVEPQRKHQALTVENIASLSNQNETGGGRGNASCEDADDTTSNTDFELALRMKRRWI